MQNRLVFLLFFLILFHKGLNFKRSPGGKILKKCEKCGRVWKVWKSAETILPFSNFSCCPFVFSEESKACQTVKGMWELWSSPSLMILTNIGQHLTAGTKWEKGVETASCDFLQFPAVFCCFLQFFAATSHIPCRSRTKSAKICENLRQAAVSPF